ncbi:MAG: antitoxin family protein [Nitrospirae bacterium]|uniref:Uncharacterized protein n=1 Tax=Candidatus Magnetobacterium casense TaxID=1455061 RepID=A0A088F8M9_9BACT|nr:antitoxin family protein [Candidatus Magnetobacterium casensis]AIM41349.1 hypothetical protein Mcas_0754 [Candidatus Magnetobacterium casensis]MBF0337281.1 antitoxin family protein [Nitrospirota bacterium]
MAKTIKVRFTSEVVKLLEKAKIPKGAELTIIFEDEKEKEQSQPIVNGKWAAVAREMSEENLLADMETDFFQWRQEFRNNFTFKESFFNKNGNE